jgi:hypothetical protein
MGLAFNGMGRARDEFFLDAQARPATAEHYVAWLEEYLAQDGKTDGLQMNKFSEARFYTVSADAKLPPLENGYALSLIVPPGVSLDVSERGGCEVYLTDNGVKPVNGQAYVWTEMLDMLINDGHPLSTLVSKDEITSCVQAAIVQDITAGKSSSNNYYEAFSRDADFASAEAMLKKMQSTNVTALLRGYLKLEAGTPIDNAAQQIINEQGQLALKALQVIHYKLDPATKEPIAAFGRRAKRPPEPKVETSGQIQVGPPIRLKDQPSP